ncbi:glycoside hydrolase [Segetibacter aerophilus]|uniref:Xylanase n=1 Tax=Segetibacter aerophilus TaxID=670293 RepID=A0A512BGP8_9BACT|nr:glycoside hydrolase [Segetibacter aerophilus]GEO11142.1 xylanase [Segetibacter aerophilus]
MPHIKLSLIFVFIVARTALSTAQVTSSRPLTISINPNNKAQIIQTFGASGCWYSESIGKHWPANKKEHIAELLFSREIDKTGNPKGIGLSAFRFNIGGGTAEQGQASGISNPSRRVECFLNPDGTYDWSKQSGYVWFLRKAKEYGVEELITFSNTPPVQFTQNGFGFKLNKDGLANLKPDKYVAYANFLTDVANHFDKEKLHFNYISPVNEPQWDWSGTVGSAKQEGSSWTNPEIYRVVKSLDSLLQARKLKSKISTPEAAMLTYLYSNKSPNSKQIQSFFADTSSLNFRNFKSLPPVVAGHSYFTDVTDSAIVNIRKAVADTARKYNVDFWQSEYSMLGDGYKEGLKGRRTPMDCALFLAKIIHNDLAVANATAWHLWNAYEPGSADFDTRYYLIALKPDSGFVNGDYTVTKNLWALGHYSLFIRPGMQRLNVKRNDNLNDIEAAQKTMVSAFKGNNGKMVIVAINYAKDQQALSIDLENMPIKTLRSYVTTAAGEDNMKATKLRNLKDVMLPSRSITTFVIN